MPRSDTAWPGAAAGSGSYEWIVCKVAGVIAAVEAAGATLRYLPLYSPDLNPIETLFSKLKTLLRKVAQRSINALWNESGNCSNASHQKNVPTTSNHRDIMHD